MTRPQRPVTAIRPGSRVLVLTDDEAGAQGIVASVHAATPTHHRRALVRLDDGRSVTVAVRWLALADHPRT